jgi:hypothetical protein
MVLAFMVVRVTQSTMVWIHANAICKRIGLVGGVGRFVNGFEKKKGPKKSDSFLKTVQNETDAGVVCQPNVGGWSRLHPKLD